MKGRKVEMKDWDTEVSKVCNEISKANGSLSEYLKANANTVTSSVSVKPNKFYPNKGGGAHMVVNIPSIHIQSFCKNGYKNGYELGKFRVGAEIEGASKIRELVDDSLPVDPENTYFGAAAISGTGIRYYGDICLVLNYDATPESTYIIDRNSFDLAREPILSRIKNAKDREIAADSLLGTWSNLGQLAAVKVLTVTYPTTRRLTTGQISQGILDDEDYIEVLKQGSFESSDVEESRISQGEATVANSIEQKFRTGPTPHLSEMIFLCQRRGAVRTLQEKGVRMIIDTTLGRVR